MNTECVKLLLREGEIRFRRQRRGKVRVLQLSPLCERCRLTDLLPVQTRRRLWQLVEQIGFHIHCKSSGSSNRLGLLLLGASLRRLFLLWLIRLQTERLENVCVIVRSLRLIQPSIYDLSELQETRRQHVIKKLTDQLTRLCLNAFHDLTF